MIPKRNTEPRQKLIEAAITVFGSKGFDGASTRNIAEVAGVNHAGISYYFSGKEPLYIACIDKIVADADIAVGGTIRQIRERLNAPRLTREKSWLLLDEYIETMMPFFVSRRYKIDTSNIVMRELLEPTLAFDRLYKGMMREMHETLALLIAHLTGLNANSRSVVVCAHAVLGQMIGFKNGHAIVARRLDIAHITDSDVNEFVSVIKKNTRGIIAAWRKP